MSTLAEPSVRDSCCDRLARLRPDAPRRWGRMTAHQMICHLNDSFQCAAGERQASPACNLFTRTIMKWGALHLPIRWPHGAPTRPEIEQGRGGTPPSDWDRDRGQLQAVIQSFSVRESFGPHPIFGEMSRRDWMIWGYRHVDHHFRQFGI